MYNIRTRPKGQSSNEDENEEQQQREITSSSIKSENEKYIEVDDAVDLKHADDVNNNVSAVHSDEKRR